MITRTIYDSIALVKRKLTTAETAKNVGIHLATLQSWIATKKVIPPKPTFRGLVGYRFWSATDVEKVRKYKAAHYWEGRGAKKKAKK